jgi:hypothetical protein
MYPHRIRLRGPWQASAVSQPPATVRMPCRMDEVWPEFRGLVRLVRSFGLPQQLDDYERIWLTFAGITGHAAIALNGEPIGQFEVAPVEVEITGRLRERNSLEVSLNCDGPGCGLWGEVALEIRCKAWLGGLIVEVKDGLLCVSGAVVGRADGPLDLYVILERSTAIQTTVEPSESGTPFALTSDPISPNGSAEAVVRVEMMSGAVAWHTQDFDINILPTERPAWPS